MASQTSSYGSQDISGQLVLITGASSGIGEASAHRFAEAGCKLVISARRTERLQELKKQLEQKGAQVHTETLDVTDLKAVQGFAERLPKGFNEIDILVNNAGLALGKSGVQDNDPDDATTMINTNVTAVAILTRLFSPGMVKRNRGHIINISSVAAHNAYAGGSIYCGTKHFLDAFTQAARYDLVGTDVRVTAISPGAVQTEFSNIRFKGDKAAADAVYDGFVPLGPRDIADNVIYAATRPANVQIGEIVVWATHQAGPATVARVLKDKTYLEEFTQKMLNNTK